MQKRTENILKELKRRLAKTLTWGYWLVLFLLVTEYPRDISRGELPPSVWEAYGLAVSQHADFGTLVYLILTYFIFYSAGFVLPYYLLCWTFAHDIKDSDAKDTPSVRFNIGTISLAFCITFVVFLRSIISSITVFFHNAPGGSLVVLWTISTFVLLFGGISGLKEERNKTRIIVRRSSKVFGECPNCGCDCVLPAQDLAYHNEREGHHQFP